MSVNMWPEMWSGYVKASSTKKKALGRRKGKARENARKLEGFFRIDPKGKEFNEFNEIWNIVQKKLELRMDSALPCNVRKTTGISSLKALTNLHEQTRDEHQQEEILSDHHHQNRCKTENAYTSMRGLRIYQNAHSQRLKTSMMMYHLVEKGSTVWVITILCRNLFLCTRQWRPQMRTPRMTKNGQSTLAGIKS